MSATFEERLKLKERSGFDAIKSKEEVLLRKEQAGKLLATRKGGKAAKKMPKEKYSKLPVSVLRPLNLDGSKAGVRRDPRFDNLSGTLNEGLFQESYSFLKDVRKERIGQLSGLISEAKHKRGGSEKLHKLREMLGEEKDQLNKGQQR